MRAESQGTFARTLSLAALYPHDSVTTAAPNPGTLFPLRPAHVVAPQRGIVLDSIEPRVRHSMKVCEQIARREARNFYFGMRLTPRARRWAIYAVYAWMRHADDVIDGAPDACSQRAALHLLTTQTHAALEPREACQASFLAPGVPGHESFWPAFAAAVAHFPIDRAWLDSLLLGLEEDAQHRGYQDLATLRAYCYRVGGTVGQVCVAIWGHHSADGAAFELAASRGRALQLINIARDIGEDARMGRSYVPCDMLAACGARAFSPAQPVGEPELRVVAALLAAAKAEMGQSRGLEALISPAAVPSLATITGIYVGVAEKLANKPLLAYQGRARLSLYEKLGVMLGAMVE